MSKSVSERSIYALLAAVSAGACFFGSGAPATAGGATGVSCVQNLTDSSGYLWDLNPNGTVADGTSDSYDDYGRLEFIPPGAASPERYPNVDTAECVLEEGDREVVYPARTLGPSGIQASRKFFVPASGTGFARFVSILSNPTTSTITGTYRFGGDLGSDSGTVVVASSSGDTTLASGDAWAVTDDASDDGGDPSLAHIYDSIASNKRDGLDGFDRFTNIGPSNLADIVNARYNVSLAPGETLAFMHIETQRQNRAAASSSAETLDDPAAEVYSGLSGAERIELENWPSGLAGMFVSDATVAEGNTGDTQATFNVTLGAASAETVTVSYSTAQGTATSPEDFTGETGTVTFQPGDTSEEITVAAKGDTLDESDEQFRVELSNPSGGMSIADGTGSGTITDDDAAPVASISDATIAEGDSSQVNATFTVTLGAASGKAASVSYATLAGTAGSPGDFAAKTGTVNFAAGDISEEVTVAVNGDTLDESDEQFSVLLSAPSNATIADGTGLGTITDDDAPPAASISGATVSEGDSGQVNATFTVNLGAASGKAASVSYATLAGTAGSPTDFAAKTGTVAFAAGETLKEVTIAVAGDTLDESDEQFSVQLSAPSNVTIADDTGIGTIVDDDDTTAAPALRVANAAAVTEGGKAVFVVTLDAPSADIVTVQYATADGTAKRPADYGAKTGTLTFAAGKTTASVRIPTKDDRSDERNEKFFLDLSTPSAASISDSRGVATIRDND